MGPTPEEVYLNIGKIVRLLSKEDVYPIETVEKHKDIRELLQQQFKESYRMTNSIACDNCDITNIVNVTVGHFTFSKIYFLISFFIWILEKKNESVKDIGQIAKDAFKEEFVNNHWKIVSEFLQARIIIMEFSTKTLPCFLQILDSNMHPEKVLFFVRMAENPSETLALTFVKRNENIRKLKYQKFFLYDDQVLINYDVYGKNHQGKWICREPFCPVTLIFPNDEKKLPCSVGFHTHTQKGKAFLSILKEKLEANEDICQPVQRIAFPFVLKIRLKASKYGGIRKNRPLYNMKIRNLWEKKPKGWQDDLVFENPNKPGSKLNKKMIRKILKFLIQKCPSLTYT
ncbi:unnamed protein product [Dimorphilus gyrociliatus]|uniref:Uncharacterized protein n=1 Tax=Dimorphilus gyrociliatus TaxID=2664684 RepID=A0A7I8WCG3_9ANNE|nr:unnamed protein product [Dimorphilus gyrociliatus]